MARITLERIRAAHRKSAKIVAIDPRALPIFERMERELAAAEAAERARNYSDPVARARAMLKAEGAHDFA